jgi:hypothetical protein
LASSVATVSTSCPETRPTVRGGSWRDVSAMLTARCVWMTASGIGSGSRQSGWKGAAANTISTGAMRRVA